MPKFIPKQDVLITVEWCRRYIINSSAYLYLMPSMRSQHALPSRQERLPCCTRQCCGRLTPWSHSFNRRVIADFEEAPAAALRNVYGDQLIVSGCWLHYAQALIKRLRKLGLTDAYRNDEETQAIFRCLLSLPLLPFDIYCISADCTTL